MPRPVDNPPNPWRSTHVEWLGEPPDAQLVVYEEEARSVLSENKSPDIPLRYSVNPYRGCQHACAYCYARPTHEYLDWGAGTDFERRIIVKTNAAECLARELRRPKVRGQTIAFSGNTDAYQPLEAHYGLTRRLLEVCVARHQPVAVITKSALVRRDIDLLRRLHDGPGARVFLSIPFLDPARARVIEPGVSSPAARFGALEALSAAGIPTGVAIAPLIPGLNDSDVPGILERARDAGAQHAFMTLLRLPGNVRGVFEERLRAGLPARADKVLSQLEVMRTGQARSSAFFERMRGAGPRWEVVEQLFLTCCRRLGIETTAGVEFDAPEPPRARQGELF